MGAVLNFSTQLTTEFCYKCGIQFAMPSDFNGTLRRELRAFYCPAGHPQVYRGESYEQELARLKQERDLAREARDRAWDEAGRARSAARNLRRRVAGGVCPCCKRTFSSLARHMKQKHPSYGGSPKAVK